MQENTELYAAYIDGETLDLHEDSFSLEHLRELSGYLRYNVEVATGIQNLVLPSFVLPDDIDKVTLEVYLNQLLQLLPNINGIDMDHCNIGFLPQLNWGQIESFWWKDSDLTPGDVRLLFSQLKWSQITCFDFSPETGKHSDTWLEQLFNGLNNLTRVNYLMLGGLNLNLQQFLQLLQIIENKPINALRLSDYNFGDLFAQELSELDENTINLWNKFADVIINSKVKKLDLSANNMHPSHLAYFIRILADKKVIELEEIHFTHSQFKLEVDDLKKIANSLKNLNIKKFNLNKSSDVSNRELLEIFDDVSSLRHPDEKLSYEQRAKLSLLTLFSAENRLRTRSPSRYLPNPWKNLDIFESVKYFMFNNNIQEADLPTGLIFDGDDLY